MGVGELGTSTEEAAACWDPRSGVSYQNSEARLVPRELGPRREGKPRES